jgi:hypothetical protein
MGLIRTSPLFHVFCGGEGWGEEEVFLNKDILLANNFLFNLNPPLPSPLLHKKRGREGTF